MFVRVGPVPATCPGVVLTKTEVLCEDGSVANLNLNLQGRSQGYDGVNDEGKSRQYPFLSLQVWLASYFAATNTFSPQKLIGRLSLTPILLVN